jgi:hypothetical protein
MQFRAQKRQLFQEPQVILFLGNMRTAVAGKTEQANTSTEF